MKILTGAFLIFAAHYVIKNVLLRQECTCPSNSKLQHDEPLIYEGTYVAKENEAVAETTPLREIETEGTGGLLVD